MKVTLLKRKTEPQSISLREANNADDTTAIMSKNKESSAEKNLEKDESHAQSDIVLPPHATAKVKGSTHGEMESSSKQSTGREISPNDAMKTACVSPPGHQKIILKIKLPTSKPAAGDPFSSVESSSLNHQTSSEPTTPKLPPLIIKKGKVTSPSTNIELEPPEPTAQKPAKSPPQEALLATVPASGDTTSQQKDEGLAHLISFKMDVPRKRKMPPKVELKNQRASLNRNIQISSDSFPSTNDETSERQPVVALSAPATSTSVVQQLSSETSQLPKISCAENVENSIDSPSKLDPLDHLLAAIVGSPNSPSRSPIPHPVSSSDSQLSLSEVLQISNEEEPDTTSQEVNVHRVQVPDVKLQTVPKVLIQNLSSTDINCLQVKTVVTPETMTSKLPQSPPKLRNKRKCMASAAQGESVEQPSHQSSAVKRILLSSEDNQRCPQRIKEIMQSAAKEKSQWFTKRAPQLIFKGIGLAPIEKKPKSGKTDKSYPPSKEAIAEGPTSAEKSSESGQGSPTAQSNSAVSEARKPASSNDKNSDPFAFSDDLPEIQPVKASIKRKRNQKSPHAAKRKASSKRECKKAVKKAKVSKVPLPLRLSPRFSNKQNPSNHSEESLESQPHTSRILNSVESTTHGLSEKHNSRDDLEQSEKLQKPIQPKSPTYASNKQISNAVETQIPQNLSKNVSESPCAADFEPLVSTHHSVDTTRSATNPQCVNSSSVLSLSSISFLPSTNPPLLNPSSTSTHPSLNPPSNSTDSSPPFNPSSPTTNSPSLEEVKKSSEKTVGECPDCLADDDIFTRGGVLPQQQYADLVDDNCSVYHDTMYNMSYLTPLQEDTDNTSPPMPASPGK